MNEHLDDQKDNMNVNDTNNTYFKKILNRSCQRKILVVFFRQVPFEARPFSHNVTFCLYQPERFTVQLIVFFNF